MGMVSSVRDLKKMLKAMGYSNSAVAEILKWYRRSDSNR
jgi:hypothetical protein